MVSKPEYVTVDEYVNRLGFGAYQWRLLFISGLAWASDAGEVMLLSFLGPAALCQWPDTSSGTEAAITTVVFVGMAVGTLVWGRIADFFGRKRGVIISGIATVVFGLASAMSPSVVWLIVMRMMTGVGIGGVPIVFSMYLELVPTKSRGFWASLIQTWWSVGTMGIAGLAWAMLESPGWRWLTGIASIPLALLTVLYWLAAVESPRYYVDQGLMGKAEETLRVIATINGKSAELAHLRLRSSAKAPAAHSPLLASSDGPAVGASAAGSTRHAGVLVGNGTASRGQDGADAAPDTHSAPGTVLQSPSSASQSSAPAERSCSAPATKSSYGAFDNDCHMADEHTLPIIASAAGAGEGKTAEGEADEEAALAVGGSGGRERGLSCGACATMVATTGGALAELVSGGQLRTSLLLWALWFGNALAYYGLVLLSTEIRVSSPSSEGASCANQQVHLSNEDYSSIFIDSAAELPGLLLAAVIADRFGRRRSQALGFGVAGLACAILVFVPVSPSLLLVVQRPASVHVCPITVVCVLAVPLAHGRLRAQAEAQLAETLLLFVARAFVLMAFTITYLYTPEIYAQHLRALGVAVANAFARVGGMIAPFIGQSLVQTGQLQVTETVFAVVCGVSMVCALLVQVETSGASLGDPTAIVGKVKAAASSSAAGKHPGSGLVASDAMLNDELADRVAALEASRSDVDGARADGDDGEDGISLAGLEVSGVIDETV